MTLKHLFLPQNWGKMDCPTKGTITIVSQREMLRGLWPPDVSKKALLYEMTHPNS
jgi:hypothetical protein